MTTKLRRRLIGICIAVALGLGGGAVFAQTGTINFLGAVYMYYYSGGAWVPYTGGGGGGGGTVTQGPQASGASGNTWYVQDTNSTAFQGVVSITPGTPTTALRSLGYICTVAGNITLTLADTSTITLPITVQSGAFQTLPFAVTNVALGTGTAGTFWNLK